MVIKKEDKYTESISNLLKEIRRRRGLTQARLASTLGVSQAWLSAIENGRGSLTGQQLLKLLADFNIPLESLGVSFADDKTSDLQNRLNLLGAGHLRNAAGLVSNLGPETGIKTVKDVLVSATSARQITSLAPVIVNIATPSLLNQLRREFLQLDLIHRWGWLLENVREAVRIGLHGPFDPLNPRTHQKFRHAEFAIGQLLSFPRFVPTDFTAGLEDTLENEISNEKSLAELREASSPISKKWGIVSRIQPSDFWNALKEANELAD